MQKMDLWNIPTSLRCSCYFKTRLECFIIGPPHDKTNKMACAPSEDSDQLPSLISLRCLHEESLVLSYPLSHSKNSDQTGRTPGLIRVFAEHKCHFVGFVMRWLICSSVLVRNTKVICNHCPQHLRGIAGLITFHYAVPYFNPDTVGTCWWVIALL